MASVALVHIWSEPVAKAHGLFPVLDGNTIPGAWKPEALQYTPDALPTP